MRTPPLAVLSLLSLAAIGCDPVIQYDGYDMPDHFPLDGSVLKWEYASTDTAVEGGLNIEKVLPTSMVDDIEVVTLEHWLIGVDDSEDLAWSVDWSSHPVSGVQIHSYSNIHDGTEVVFDPPVLFAEKRAVPGDQFVTQSGGFTWTATFQGVDGCGTYWVPGWEDEECLVVNLDDGDGTDVTNGVIVGTYWLVPRYGAAWLELDAYGTLWSLADQSWQE